MDFQHHSEIGFSNFDNIMQMKECVLLKDIC